MRTLPVRLDRGAADPLGVQLSSQVRELVLGGTLQAGDRLPSTRALAADLGVARSVTEQAYDQLLAEGWLTSRQGAGTFVASGGGPRTVARSRPPRAPQADLITLDLGSPWIDPRHAAGWRRAWRDVSTAPPPRGYPDPRGIPELRAEIADRLARTRGLTVDPDEVLLTAGTTDGLRQLLPHLPTGAVGVDDPGYRAACETVVAAGREVVDLTPGEPIRVRGLGAVYATPAHQHPLGHVMPAADRLALLDSAREHGAIVIEDDYDSEFRYDVAPIPALASLERSHVAYLGTASKSVGPGLRIGWMVPTPDALTALLRQREQTYDMPSWPTQRALLTLLREGWVDKVVRTARRVYADRAPRVASTLAPHGTPAGPAAGMYSTWLMPPVAVQKARAAAREAGFEVAPISNYCRNAQMSGLVVGFGGVTDAELDRALAAIGRGLEER
ncbi:PLP-dependent aminotransferase family protein [Nocardioides humilatus]|uniref:PLP-dependent aminotransferase family protein n=1 Tax=Nocardioides humilatus TaxID=2607660 RepID=A0A5B1LBG5_9ACTN|nr:PLP-dependent aminotransferase family protein [Nocardioides humilatus]KAA1417019.1 PLP-dependent aminotransferase family protein [Nocardioides humilatus]